MCVLLSWDGANQDPGNGEELWDYVRQKWRHGDEADCHTFPLPAVPQRGKEDRSFQEISGLAKNVQDKTGPEHRESWGSKWL